ncbi:hypothetical protein GCM10023107_38920 [Actinoplanes octamycinicus]|uniref:glycosyltransferase n=1 Tax=Actinoplanes octamycinicus TaxID=135948 RepID=UPI0031E6D9CB
MLGVSRRDIEAWRPGRGYRPETRLRVTGPLFAHLPIPLPAEIAEFLDVPVPAGAHGSPGPVETTVSAGLAHADQPGRSRRSRRPVIYVAITSSPPSLVRAVVRALRPLGARILVAATVHDLADLADDQVMVGGVLPSHLVMPRVDLAVTAGGQGSVQTAMAAGVPLLGIPLQLEQDLNVTLLERRGAARWVAPRQAGSSRLTALASELLTDGRYRRAAEAIREVYAATDGPANAAEQILSVRP